jgi:hypothetical protein
LIALLPGRTDPNIPAAREASKGHSCDAKAVALRRRSIVVAMILVICMLFLMGVMLERSGREHPTLMPDPGRKLETS